MQTKLRYTGGIWTRTTVYTLKWYCGSCGNVNRTSLPHCPTSVRAKCGHCHKSTDLTNLRPPK